MNCLNFFPFFFKVFIFDNLLKLSFFFSFFEILFIRLFFYLRKEFFIKFLSKKTNEQKNIKGEFK